MRQRGFSLIELAIVLGVLGVLLGGLFQLTAASSRTIQDQVTAQQIQQYVRATKAYLASRMQVGAGAPAAVSIGIAPEVVINPAVNSVTDITARVQAFRAGLSTLSPQGSTFQVRLRRMADVPTVSGNEPMFAIGVFLTGGNAIQRAQMGSIATLVGAEGAAVYSGVTFGEGDIAATTGCNEALTTIRSSFGAACIDGAFMDGGLGVLAAERAAAMTYGSPSDFSNSVSQWLSRVAVAGAPQLTTMSTNLTMGGTGVAPGNDIVMTDAQNDLTMNGGSISDIAGAVNINDTVNILANGGLTFNGAAAAISNITGDVTVADNLTIGTGNSLAMNGSIIGTSGGGVQGMTFFNSSGGVTFPLNVGPGTVAGDTSLLTFGTIASTVGMRVEGSLSARSFIYVASDRRLKENIRPIDTALDKLMQIDGVSYRLKSSGQKTMGVIAQEVEKVFPELVTMGPDETRMVNYNGLTGVLVQAVHELAAENKELRARLEKLEAKSSNTRPVSAGTR